MINPAKLADPLYKIHYILEELGFECYRAYSRFDSVIIGKELCRIMRFGSSIEFPAFNRYARDVDFIRHIYAIWLLDGYDEDDLLHPLAPYEAAMYAEDVFSRNGLKMLDT